MVYIHIVDLESLMLHDEFQDPRPLGSGEEIFKGFYHIWACCHLGHVTWIVYIHIGSHFP